MRLLLQALRTKDYAIILKYLRLQGELTAGKILYCFLYSVLAIAIGIPLVLIFIAIAVVFIVVYLFVVIIFFLVVMIARLFGKDKDIVRWLQERKKQKQSNENNWN